MSRRGTRYIVGKRPVMIEREAIEDKRFEEHGFDGFKAFRLLAIINGYIERGDSGIELDDVLEEIGWQKEDADASARLLIEFGYLIGEQV